VSIVPPFPTAMGGFADRTAQFTGVHDDLYVRALFLDDGETRLMILGSDLIYSDGQLTRRVRARLSAEAGVPPDHILLGAAHNHSSPSGFQRLPAGETNPLLDFLVERFTEAGLEARRSAAPARLGFGAGRLEGATRNRQQANETVIDPQVGVLRVESAEDRSLIAALFNFTGHPVILGSQNLLLSGEYPGQAARTIEEVLGGVAIFTQGAAGDVTVHRQGDPFLEVARVGRLLAGEVIKTAEFIRPAADAGLAAGSTVVTLAARAFPSPEVARAELQRARAELEAARGRGERPEVARELEAIVRLRESDVRGAEARAASDELPLTVEAEVQVARIGELVLIAIPGELFVEYALEMRQRTAQALGKATVVVGYANDHLGYIVTPRAVRTGGYEASVTRLDETAGRELTEAALRLAYEVVK